MIKEYLFGLIQCYDCQGVCYLGEWEFSSTIFCLVPLMIAITIIFLFYIANYARSWER
jgi:hypothetical protein